MGDDHHRRAVDVGYEVGVRFLAEESNFRMRMVEQVCYIEQYKRELKEARDRLAALESKEDEGLKSKVEELDTRAKEALDQGEMAEYHKLNRELVRAELE